jgi:hypothetical protein
LRTAEIGKGPATIRSRVASIRFLCSLIEKKTRTMRYSKIRRRSNYCSSKQSFPTCPFVIPTWRSSKTIRPTLFVLMKWRLAAVRVVATRPTFVPRVTARVSTTFTVALVQEHVALLLADFQRDPDFQRAKKDFIATIYLLTQSLAIILQMHVILIPLVLWGSEVTKLLYYPRVPPRRMQPHASQRMSKFDFQQARTNESLFFFTSLIFYFVFLFQSL